MTRHPAPLPDNPAEKLCILCGRCLEVCPLFNATRREELSPRSKFLLAQRLEAEPGALREMAAEKLASLCLACGRCENACPQGKCAPDLVSRLRARHPGWQGWFWRQWIEKGAALWPAASAIAGLAPASLTAPGKPARALAGLKALRPEAAVRPWVRVKAFDSRGDGRKAVAFAGCLARNLRSDWTDKALALLAGLGYAAAGDEGFACCGCTLGHAGQPAAQEQAQRRNLAAWRAAGRPLLAVFCATCRHGLRAYPAFDLGWEPGEATAWLAAVQPLSGLFGSTEFEVLEDAAPPRAHYHTSCHGAEGGHDAAWLRAVAGERLGRVSDGRCCGMGGVLQLAAPDLSRQVAGTLWDFFAARPGEQALTGCSGCVLQLAATAPKGVAAAHWLDTLTTTNG
ncbi:MAG: (Fe-S)-binding protein [Thermodesulfobacteriota bacterium]